LIEDVNNDREDRAARSLPVVGRKRATEIGLAAPAVAYAAGERPRMDLRQYLSIIAARKYLVAAAVIAALVVAAILTLLPAREWKASATLQAQPGSALVGGSVRSDDLAYLDRLINTYSKMVASTEFADHVARTAGLRERPTLAVKAPANTDIIGIQATAADAASSAAAANAAGRELVARVQQGAEADLRTMDEAFQRRTQDIESSIAAAQVQLDALKSGPQTAGNRRAAIKLGEQIAGQRVSVTALRTDYEAKRDSQVARASTVSLVGEAARPIAPQSRRLRLVLPFGLVFGLLAGVGLALAAENLAQRFRSEGEIEAALEAPVMATVPRISEAADSRLFKPGSRGDEAVRRLRTQLLLPDREPLRRVLLASAKPGEGKSTIAANLACSVAASGRSVLLIDADLRIPTIHRFFGLARGAGLSDLLSDASPAGPVAWRDMVQHVERRGVTVLPAGGPVPDAATLLGSQAMARLLEEASLSFDMVILDSPALLAVSDALALTPMVDAVLLVAGSHVEPEALQNANQQLRRAGAPPLGLVVNGVDAGRLYNYGSYHATGA
jgi:capsular exopolysaccharide synthesis family protein